MKSRLLKWVLTATCGIAMLGMFSLGAHAANGDVVIDENTFPDKIFREYVLQNFDTDGNKGVLSQAERYAVNTISVSFKGVSSLSGIENFNNLKYLDCVKNQLSELDLSGNPELLVVECDENQLTMLNLSKNPKLNVLYCNMNQLTTLDISHNPQLEYLQCYLNNFSNLDVSNNPLLNCIACDYQILYNLRDYIAKQTSSDYFYFGTINIPVVKNADGLYVGDLSKLENFDVSLGSSWNGLMVKGTTAYFGDYDYDPREGLPDCYYQLTEQKEIYLSFNPLKNQIAGVITKQPADAKVTEGEKASFKVEVEGSDLTYQWQFSKDGGKTWSNSTVSSAKTANLSFIAKETYSGRLYRCVVTNDSGKVNSNTASLTVKAAASKPVITTQPTNVTVETGKTVKFSVAATGEGLTYQWKVSKDGGSTWANSTVTSAKTATLNFTASASYSGRMYRCVVSNASGSVTTKDVALTVKAAAAKPVITTQPTNVTVETGKTVKFSVAATGEGLTYQWKVSKDGGSTWANSTVTSAKTATLSFTASASYSGRMYRCVVTNASGSVTTKDVTLTVGAKPVITTQPANATAVNGKNVKFSVIATGEGLTYQWQVSTDGGKTWADSAATSAKTATLSFTAKTSYNGRVYRCVVTNEAGSVSSAVATLNVNK